VNQKKDKDHPRKAYENALQPNLKKLSEVNRMYLFSYSVQTILANKLDRVTLAEGILGEEAMHLYRKSDSDLLRSFSDAQQLKNHHSNQSTICQHLRDMVTTLTETLGTKKNAYMYRNPEFLICLRDSHWLENKFQLDFGFTLEPKIKDSKMVELKTLCKNTPLMSVLMQKRENVGFHDDYEDLHIQTPPPPRVTGQKADRAIPYYTVSPRVTRWVARLTHRIIRLLDQIPDPGLRHALECTKVNVNPYGNPGDETTKIDKIDTVFLQLANQAQLFTTTIRKLFNLSIREDSRPILTLWNVLVNCLSYYPGLTKTEQPVDALINLLGCNGIPSDPILHEPSQYVDGDESSEQNLHAYKKYITYPDGKFDPQSTFARCALIQKHELQVSKKNKPIRIAIRNGLQKKY